MALCDQSIYCLSYKNTEELSFTTLKRYANFEEKLTCGFEKRIEKFGKIFTRALESVKFGTLMRSFCRKGMTLKFAVELCVMAMKNNAKFVELTCYFNNDMRNLTNVDSSTL